MNLKKPLKYNQTQVFIKLHPCYDRIYNDNKHLFYFSEYFNLRTIWKINKKNM